MSCSSPGSKQTASIYAWQKQSSWVTWLNSKKKPRADENKMYPLQFPASQADLATLFNQNSKAICSVYKVWKLSFWTQRPYVIPPKDCHPCESRNPGVWIAGPFNLVQNRQVRHDKYWCEILHPKKLPIRHSERNEVEWRISRVRIILFIGL